MKIDLLDHGFVRLVSMMGSDLDISRAARVSYDAPPREKDGGLIRYLLKNHHTSPFEAVTMTFEVKAPIFVLRQWHRHRTWSYNEVSARYTELPEEVYCPAGDIVGVQHDSNKQMRKDVEWSAGKMARVRGAFINNAQDSFECYRWMLEEGVPRELARSVLPMGTYSRMFATVDLHNLFHFLRLRLHEHSQYEIRVYAQAMLQLIEQQVPLAVKAFKEFE